MPGTFQSLAVTAVVLLPGALYIWAFERQAGRWGVGLSDRLLRFIGGSALFHAAVAPGTYWLWTTQWPRLRTSRPVSLWLWLAVAAYVLVPLVAGTTIGRGTRRGTTWARWFTGPDPAPRAWDHVFQHEADAWVRLRLKSGTWLGGAYATANGRQSYTAGYPEAQDIYLAAAVPVDPDTGEFQTNHHGSIEVLPGRTARPLGGGRVP